MDFSLRADGIHRGPAWHGRSTKELLVGLTGEQARQRPAEGVHSVAELVGHMMAWRDWAVHMLQGDVGYRLAVNSELDWPDYSDLTDDQWNELLAANDAQVELLKSLVAGMTDEQLDNKVGDRPFDYQWAIQFVLDHDLYHGGQIAVARRLINAPYPPDGEE